MKMTVPVSIFLKPLTLFVHLMVLRAERTFPVATRKTQAKKSSFSNTCSSTLASSRSSTTPLESFYWHHRMSVAKTSSSARQSDRPNFPSLSSMAIRTAPSSFQTILSMRSCRYLISYQRSFPALPTSLTSGRRAIASTSPSCSALCSSVSVTTPMLYTARPRKRSRQRTSQT